MMRVLSLLFALTIAAPVWAQSLVREVIVDTSTSPAQVVNVIEYPQTVTGQPPGMAAQFAAVPSTTAQIGWTYSNGTFTAPPAPAPTPQQQSAAALAGGCPITSASTAALNGNYPTDPQSVTNMLAEADAINIDGVFTTGQSSIPWPRIGAAPVILSTAQFTSVRKACQPWITGWMQYGSGLVSTPPSAPAALP